MIDPLEQKSALERARGMLRQAERWGDLDPLEQTQMAAMGASPLKVQAAELHYAQALAMVSIAESLDAIRDSLAWSAVLSQGDERMAGDD